MKPITKFKTRIISKKETFVWLSYLIKRNFCWRLYKSPDGFVLDKWNIFLWFCANCLKNKQDEFNQWNSHEINSYCNMVNVVVNKDIRWSCLASSLAHWIK